MKKNISSKSGKLVLKIVKPAVAYRYVSSRMTADLVKRLDDAASKAGVTRSQAVCQIIEQALGSK